MFFLVHVVIPAQAGIQFINGSRASRATQKLIAVSAPRAGDFSLLVQREVTKRKHARVAHRA
jgi:hypothetical protein